MAAYFIDSSALVKAYIIETGTVWTQCNWLLRWTPKAL